MDISRVTSDGKYSQSMGTKEICILVVNDDHVWRNIVAYMLQNSIDSEVFNFKRATDALNTIGERKDRVELVLTNFYRTDTNRFGIIQHIENEFSLPIILMNPDDNTKILSQGLDNATTVCFLKSLSINDINDLWKYTSAREKGKMVIAEGVESARRESIPENVADTGMGNASFVGKATRIYQQKRKRKESKETSEQNEGSGDDCPMEKKPRVIWTKEMHEKFLEAIEQLGYERAFPKKIVEVMNVPGLTRENVASHLQKYRMCRKRAQEGSFNGINLTSDVKEPCFPSGCSSLNFSSSHGNSQHLNWRPSQQGFRSIISIPSSSHSGFVNPGPQSFTVNTKQNQNFRVYSDQTKKILSSIENNRFYGNAQPADSDTSSSFIGFRLAVDGKSVEFGQTRALSNDEIRKEMQFHVGGNSADGNCISLLQHFVGNQNSNQYNFPQQQSSLSLLGTTGNENSKQCLSTSIKCTPLHQSSLPPLGTTGSQNSNRCPLSFINCIPQHQSTMPILGTNGNTDSKEYPSTSINCIPQQLPPLGANGNQNSDQCLLSHINCIPQQQSFMSILGTNGSEKYDQCPLTSDNCVPHHQPYLPLLGTNWNENSEQHNLISVNSIPEEEACLPPLPPLLQEVDDFGAYGVLDNLLHVTDSTSPQMFWDADFEDALFNNAD